MEQALQTKQRFDPYGLHFESDQSAINADGTSLLDDIATAEAPYWLFDRRWRQRLLNNGLLMVKTTR